VSTQPKLGIVAVELKVNSTSRAIGQAVLNQYVAPCSWVATWATPSSVIFQRAETQGVGILLVTDRGVYPALYPRVGQPRTAALGDHLMTRRRRARDLLSALRHG
jgi:hypothetical protein